MLSFIPDLFFILTVIVPTEAVSHTGRHHALHGDMRDVDYRTV